MHPVNMEKSDPDRAVPEGDLAELIQGKGVGVRGWSGCTRTQLCGVLLTLLTLTALLLDFPDLESHSIGDASRPEPVLVCYYNAPAAAGGLQPEDIVPQLCTHINVAFASVRDKRVHVEPELGAALQRVVRLKRAAPRLRVLLSVGGAGAGGFSDMVVDHASRKMFIQSVKLVLRDYNLDGIDLDWEFPVVHSVMNRSRERQHFSQLLREIRAEYNRENRDYLLTVAVAAPEVIVNVAYDIDQLNLYTDFVNLMTYDYHFYSKLTPFTGFNSPLYGEPGEKLYMSTLNINHTVRMYLEGGLSRQKTVLGVPAYGHSFRLVNEESAAPGAPAAGVGATGTDGFVDYATACAMARGGAARDERAAVPYLHRGSEWVSYDDERSIARKGAFLCGTGLRGAMIYSLNTDDHRGACAPGAPRARFPLASTLRRALEHHVVSVND